MKEWYAGTLGPIITEEARKANTEASKIIAAVNGKISAEQYATMIRNASEKFRITTDGRRYRVEKLVAYGVFSRKTKWDPVGKYVYPVFVITYYGSKNEADAGMAEAIKIEVANLIGFIPVSYLSDELRPEFSNKPQADHGVLPAGDSRFVYRAVKDAEFRSGHFEIGECDSPRSFPDMWCDRRVCEGFWGDEKMVCLAVRALNDLDAKQKAT